MAKRGVTWPSTALWKRETAQTGGGIIRPSKRFGLDFSVFDDKRSSFDKIIAWGSQTCLAESSGEVLGCGPGTAKLCMGGGKKRDWRGHVSCRCSQGKDRSVGKNSSSYSRPTTAASGKSELRKGP